MHTAIILNTNIPYTKIFKTNLLDRRIYRVLILNTRLPVPGVSLGCVGRIDVPTANPTWRRGSNREVYRVF